MAQHDRQSLQVVTRRTEERSCPLDELDFSLKICMIYLAYVTRWKPYDLHGLAHVSWFGSVPLCYIQILSQHLKTATMGSTLLDYLDRHLFPCVSSKGWL